MQSFRSVRKLALVLIVAVVVFSLAACGSSEYIDAFNPAMDTFNSAAQDINTQIEKLNQDNAMLSDPTWQEETNAVLGTFNEAGKALAALPDAPEELTQVNNLVQEMAFETNLFVNAYYNMIENQDISQINEANSHMDNINNLIVQSNDAITATEQ